MGLLVGLAVRAPTLPFDPASMSFTPYCRPTEVSFEVNGEPAPLVAARSGDHVEVTFEVPEGCRSRVAFASFVAPAPAFDGSRLHQQALFSRETGVFGPGRHSMAVDVYDFPDDGAHDCVSARAAARASTAVLRQEVQRQMAADPVYREQVIRETARRAAAGEALHPNGPYDAPCEEGPADNGKGDGNAAGKPCAGCVGAADDNVPPPQAPDGSDHDAGHECDRNQGIGQGNPAHTGCTNFQVDLSYHPLDEEEGGRGGHASVHDHESGLIAGVFCVRPTAQCYVTDRTSTDAVLEE